MRVKTFSMKGSLILCLLAGLATLLLPSFAREPIRTVTGTVTKVSDGDTIHVTTPEQTKLTVRLYGIDTTETPKINQHTGHVNKPGNHSAKRFRGLLYETRGMHAWIKEKLIEKQEFMQTPQERS